MSVAAEEYVMIGDDIRLVFLGGTGNHMRIMIDAPRELNIVRSRALEKRIQDPELRARMPHYYREEEHPEKYKKKISPLPETQALCEDVFPDRKKAWMPD